MFNWMPKKQPHHVKRQSLTKHTSKRRPRKNATEILNATENV